MISSFANILVLVLLLLLQLAADTHQQDELDIKQRFGRNSEPMLNDQITREFKAMMLYESLSSFFGRPSQALPGFQKFFRKAADEEREHAHKLIDYLNKRGGHVKMKSIPAHTEYEWESPLEAVTTALNAEVQITKDLYALRDNAEKEDDAHLVDYIESEFLTEQVDGIKELRELIAKLKRVGSGVGEFLIDKEL